MIAEKLYKHDYVVEQTDMPFLVRKDNQRFLRAADVVKGGDENAFYLWDEASNKIVIAPGCEGRWRWWPQLGLGNIKPALSGTRQVKLADGSTVECITVFDKIKALLDAEYTPEQAAKVTGCTRMSSAPSRVRWRQPPVVDDFRLVGRLQALPQRSVPARHGAADDLTGNQGKQGGGMRLLAWWWHGRPRCDERWHADGNGQDEADPEGHPWPDAA
jgi:hypothetical protein